jgi:hypothetical protein
MNNYRHQIASPVNESCKKITHLTSEVDSWSKQLLCLLKTYLVSHGHPVVGVSAIVP